MNPAAEKGDCESTIWPCVEKHFKERNITYDLERTSFPGHGTILAKKAVEDGFDTIVSVGGDGSANEIINGIAGSNVTFGIIPAGVGNDFVKMIGLSVKNTEEACNTILEGYTKKIDIGLVNEKYFLNMVGIGFDGEVAEAKAKSPKYFRGFYAYLIQLLLLALTYKPKNIKIKIDGVSIEANMLALSIGNGRYAGGGFKLTPDAEIDDGLFDICLIKYPGVLGIFWNTPKVPTGEHIHLPITTMFKANEITVSSDSLLTAHVDGEVVKEKTFHLKILPQALRLLVKKQV